MFTVKIMRSDHTDEISECARVSYKAGQLTLREEGGEDVYICNMPPAPPEGVAERNVLMTVYIMNRFGATVATYHL